MSSDLDSLFAQLQTCGLLDLLHSRVNLTRSSRYGLRRHAILHGPSYARAMGALGEAASLDPRPLAWRGRAQRMRGEEESARRDLDAALEASPRLASALAWRWELSCGNGREPRPLSGITAAIRLEPREPWWRVWRGLALLPIEGKPSRAGCRAALLDFEAAIELEQGLALAHAGRAMGLAGIGRSREALESLDRALALEPRQAWLRHLKARLALEMGGLAEFVQEAGAALLLDEGLGYFSHALGRIEGRSPRLYAEAAERFLSSHPGAYWMRVYRGDLRRSPEINDFEGALRDYEEALALKPECAWAWAYLSRARMTRGETAAALGAIERARGLEPDCAWFRVWQGEILRRSGELKASLGAFDAGLAADPDYEFAYAWRGGARRALGRAREALEDLDMAARLDPSYAWARHERALCLRALGRVPEAIEEMEAACGLDPKYSWWNGRGAEREGFAELERGLRLRPGCASAYAWRGEGRFHRGDLRGALLDFSRAARLKPSLGRARFWRARTLEALGRRRAALAELDRAAGLEGWQAQVLAWRGRLRAQQGLGPQALEDLGAAAALEPRAAWILAWKAEAALAQGRCREARLDLDKALALDPRHWQALALRAEALSQEGCVEEAIADLGGALKLRGADSGLLGRRARFHLQRRNYQEARADLDRAVRLSPREVFLLAQRAELFTLTDRLDLARKDLDRALRLSPRELSLRLARLRLDVQQGRRGQALRGIRWLMARSLRERSEGRFYRGCLGFKEGRAGRGAADFRRVMAAWPAEDPLSMRARFYWAASRAVEPGFRRRHGMKDTRTRTSRLFLCGLGIFPPYTASLEVLHALSRCDLLFNNIAGEEVRQFLAEFCADIRPASYQAWQDEPKWADRIFTELRRGKRVGFVTRGHPLVFGGLACELLRRCREEGVAHESFGAVSAIDHLLAYMGKGLGDHFEGIQVFDRPAIERARSLNTDQPLLACFYSGVEADRVGTFRRSLERFYPGGHEVWMFGPKYDAEPARLPLGELESRYPGIHSSLMLYVPALHKRQARGRS